MKGILYKDFLIIKKQIRFFIIPLIFFLISFITEKSLYFTYYAVAILSVLPSNIIGNEENWRWNKYEIILPVSREKLVTEKYLLTLILVIPTVLFEGIIFMIIYDFSIKAILGWISINLFCGVIIPSINLPIIMKFGYMKGRIINMIIIIAISISIALINMKSSSGESLINGSFTPMKNVYLFAVAAAVIFIISCLLSIKLYSKREF